MRHRSAIFEASQPTSSIVSGGEGEAAIANHLHDHASIRQQLQQLAGVATVPFSVIGCCEVDKHSSSLLFSWKAVHNVLCQQGDLVYVSIVTWSGLRSTSRVESPTAPEGAMGQWLGRHERRLVSRGFWRGHTAEIWAGSSFGSSNGFSGLRIATISALLQIFGILSWLMQELRKSQNQDLRADLAWSMNSGKMESNPRDFLGFRRLRAVGSSSGLKSSEILWRLGVGIFHRSDSSLLTSLVDSRSPVLCAQFFTSCEAMEFAETGLWRKERPDLPVSLLMVLHAFSASVRELDGIYSFLPSLLLLFEAR